MSARFVVLGLARPKISWFAEVGRWATSGSAPVEFIRCVSREELATHLGSGRPYSAMLIDGASLELDRDLVEDATTAGAATIVVDDGSIRRDWTGLGVHAVLPSDFSRADLVLALDAHATPLERTALTLDRAVGPPGTQAAPDGTEDPAGGLARPGRWISVVGAGSGTSLLAMALAQSLGDRQDRDDAVVLADLALDADQAMLHAAPDIVPGISELVEAHRGGRVEPQRVRELTFAVDGRGYHLLLGLRRHRDWSALRPRALQAALSSLNVVFPLVVADVDPDVEGEADCGSVDVEERNGLARAAVQRADVVIVVGTAQLSGVHHLVRTIDRLRSFGVAAERILPVVNHAPRQPRARAELSRAIATLCAPTGVLAIAGTLFVPTVRRVDAIVRDGGRLPDQLGRAMAIAVTTLLERSVAVAGGWTEAVPVKPGELGQRLTERAAS